MSYLRWSLLALSCLALALDLVAWGGLRETAAVGPSVLKSARKEAPLALFYLQAGGATVSALGITAWSRSVAEAQFGSAYPYLHSRPEAAMDVVFAEMSALMRLSHPGAPLLLLAGAVLWWLRPRQISTIRRR